MSFALWACLIFSADPQPADAVIVAPREFLAALKPLIEHRQQQGHRFAYVPAGASCEQTRAAIRGVASGGGLKYVLIVGDADPTTPGTERHGGRSLQSATRAVPTHLHPAVVNVNYGSEPH